MEPENSRNLSQFPRFDAKWCNWRPFWPFYFFRFNSLVSNENSGSNWKIRTENIIGLGLPQVAGQKGPNSFFCYEHNDGVLKYSYSFKRTKRNCRFTAISTYTARQTAMRSSVRNFTSPIISSPSYDLAWPHLLPVTERLILLRISF